MRVGHRFIIYRLAKKSENPLGKQIKRNCICIAIWRNQSSTRICIPCILFALQFFDHLEDFVSTNISILNTLKTTDMEFPVSFIAIPFLLMQRWQMAKVFPRDYDSMPIKDLGIGEQRSSLGMSSLWLCNIDWLSLFLRHWYNSSSMYLFEYVQFKMECIYFVIVNFELW